MTRAQIWTALEQDQAWREEELRHLRNYASALDEGERERFRRAIVLMLYAHLEGYVKVALLSYVNHVNAQKLTCGKATVALAAASMAELFAALRDPSSKSDFFREKAPDDSRLHLAARDMEFVARAGEIQKRRVLIPDAVVDTESNLQPVVLRKLLFRLGFQHDLMSDVEGTIKYLVRVRNDIAHGQRKEGLKSEEFENLWVSTLTVMGRVKREVMDAIIARKFVRPAKAKAA